MNGSRSCDAATVFTIRSKLRACFFISSASFETTTSSAPSRLPSSTFDGDVVNSTVCAPNAWANFTPMCPSPPRPTMPTFLPGPAPQCLQRRVQRDARAQQRRGAGQVELRRDAQDELLVDDDPLGVAAVGRRARSCAGRASCR